MKNRKFMPFYWAVDRNCPAELSQRIEKLLGECLPENFIPQSGKISGEVTKIWTHTLANSVEEIKQMSLFLEAQKLFAHYVADFTEQIKRNQLRIIDRLAIIQLVQACWAFPALAETCDLEAFLTLCEQHQKDIF